MHLDCRYFYPFGTFDHTSEFEFGPYTRKQNSHVLFYFDQEPIYDDSGYALNSGTNTNYLKTARILANSEISPLKKYFCRQFSLLDWYFFYHGFACLDWYQDTAYLDHDLGFSHAFLSFNHLVRDKRAYRMALTARLAERDLLGAGLVSFHGNQEDCRNEIENEHTQLTNHDRHLVQTYLMRQQLPRVADHQRVDGTFSARMGHQEYAWRQRGLFHVVNETIFYDEKLHLTEKIFQPIVCGRPFILAAAPGNLAYLQRYGFQTFSAWIDEGYDTIQDPNQRLDAIANVIDGIANLPPASLRRMWQDMRGVLDHNKRHFFTGFRQMIVDEMVDNLDTCRAIWNNGRVDGRELPRHPDLAHAKRILLR